MAIFDWPRADSGWESLILSLHYILEGDVPSSTDLLIPQVLRDLAARMRPSLKPWKALERQEDGLGSDEFWTNDVYAVWLDRHHGKLEDGDEVSEMLHLSFKRHDKGTTIPWRHKQFIKNQLAGRESTAVEVFPAEKYLVDTTNQYHLWCFVGVDYIVGFRERVVASGSRNGSVQEPWPEGDEPDDVVNAADLDPGGPA